MADTACDVSPGTANGTAALDVVGSSVAAAQAEHQVEGRLLLSSFWMLESDMVTTLPRANRPSARMCAELLMV